MEDKGRQSWDGQVSIRSGSCSLRWGGQGPSPTWKPRILWGGALLPTAGGKNKDWGEGGGSLTVPQALSAAFCPFSQRLRLRAQRHPHPPRGQRLLGPLHRPREGPPNRGVVPI